MMLLSLHPSIIVSFFSSPSTSSFVTPANFPRAVTWPMTSRIRLPHVEEEGDMFELCRDCRRAYNFSGAVTATPEKRNSSHCSRENDEKCSATATVDDDVISSEGSRDRGGSGAEGSLGVEGEVGSSPAAKKVRVDETSEERVRVGGMVDSVTGDVSCEGGEGEGGGGGECEGGASEECEVGGGGVSEGEGEDTETSECLSKSNANSPEPRLGAEGNSKIDILETTSVKTDSSERDTVGPSAPLCSSCLGLLDDSFVDQLSTAVSEELARANYEHLATFSLSLSTPLSLMIRQCAVLFYLRENFEITDEPAQPHDGFVKESLRHKLYLKLRSKLCPLTSDIESPFQVIVKLDRSGSSVECRLAAKTWPEAFPGTRRKKRRKWQRKKLQSKSSDQENSVFNTTSVTRALSGATSADFEKSDFISASFPCTYSISFLHSPLFVGGRYCKYTRDLPQTPWIIDGVRKVETSVQELICGRIERFVRSSNVRFSSSGREDCDVRMLGDGRPFLVELVNPRKTLLARTEVETLEREINSDTDLVEVKRLRVMGKADAARLKEGEAEKKKEYKAFVCAPREVTQQEMDRLGEMKETVLHQKTPIRVLHRRSLATRDRTVHCMRAELVDPRHFYLELTTQAGTYIKEFVHGDFGRTVPNLRSILGQDVDIVSLDVCSVLLEWPPRDS